MKKNKNQSFEEKMGESITENAEVKVFTQNTEKSVSFSEQRMKKLDEQIKQLIDEAIIKEKKREKLEFFRPESISTKKKLKVESKIKAIRQIEPEYLINYKKSPVKHTKEDIRNFIDHYRSTSTLNLSPSLSRITPGSNIFYKNSFDSAKKQYSDDSKARPSSEDYNDYSSICKEFVKNGNIMQKNLRKAFSKKIRICNL